MSELLPGISAAPAAPVRLRDASAVILMRDSPGGPEVFWIRRGAKLKFAGGFYAFPGGRVDRADSSIAVKGASGEEAALIAAAARELFEETGVLAATPPVKTSPDMLAEQRKALLESKRTFAEILAVTGATLDAATFRPAGRWVTPPFLPTRFDARFFLVQMPAGQTAEVWEGELAEGGWIAPTDALLRWEKGEALLHPPNFHALLVLAGFTTLESALAKLNDPPHAPNFIAQRIEFQRGIFLLPLVTPTLPPATHTNCYLVGHGDFLIVDPGSPDRREQAKLAAFVMGLVAEGRRARAIVLTHHHADHIGGAQALKERLDLPIWAHELTANRVPGVERILVDGEVLTLAGSPPMKLTVIHTPGHAKGHLCLYDAESRALICGDMVAGLGSIVIDPPEGDLEDYLASLERMRNLPAGTLYPAHGPAIAEGSQKLWEYTNHREMRQSQIFEALNGGPLTIRMIVERVYTETPPALHALAERSAHASLIRLARQGKVARLGELFKQK